MPFTADQILSLAPDPASAKAGRGLATTAKWSDLQRSSNGDAETIWGACKGSGKEPYRTVIDLSEPAFRCSCPSHKFPCKHSLGLFLLLAQSPSLFVEAPQPDWVEAWIASRLEREKKRASKAAATDAPAPEAVAKSKAKRADAREKKVAAGVDDLDRWIRDLIRQGLAAASERPTRYWEEMGARLVDAQAPGLARRVRALGTVQYSGAGWQERMLARLGGLHLLLQGYRNIERLAPDLVAEIRSQIGWTVEQDEVLRGETVADRWLVVGRVVEEENRIQTIRTWLRGATTGRDALLLAFKVHGQQRVVDGIGNGDPLPWTTFDGEVVFYPGRSPLRALVRSHGPGEPADQQALDPCSIAAAVEVYGNALSSNPWLELYPMLVGPIRPVEIGDRMFVSGVDGDAIPLSERFTKRWALLAFCSEGPVTLFGEWNGETLMPAAAWRDGRMLGL